MDSNQMPAKSPEVIGWETKSWNELSDMGLIYRINNEILHPLGLAMYRTGDGNSPGVLVSPDGKFEYSEETHKKYEHTRTEIS